ncbi:MAG: glycosyltransferase [Chlorobi bacterium]|nr:glycosyltransferase [Chlorobiota bacterium]
MKYDYLVYDYQDNFDYGYDGVLNKIAFDYNGKVISESDLVICTARVMYERAVKINPNSVIVNNGNDYKTLTVMPSNINTEMSNIKSPIIGYLGGIRNWIDFDLMKFLITNLKDVNFVFISLVYRNARREFENLLVHNNVKWISYKDQDLLPAYLNKFNVGIIPFKLNEFMKGVFPNKFFEYMACEVPIVTTHLPELQKYSDIIGYSGTKVEFLENCRKAISGDFREKVKQYRKLAELNSWEKKAEKINSHIKKILK